MRRPLAFAVVLLVVLASVPLPVSAHSNHLTATSQVSDDGTLLVETVFVSQRAHLVVHADDGGEMGAALGSRSLTPGGLVRDVEVDVAADQWDQWGENRTVWLALHADDGDGEYDADDPVYTRFNRPVAERVAVGKGSPAIVTGQGFLGQYTDGPEVTVGRVTLPDDGLVVARDNETGDVLGTRALAAGTHREVAIGLNESFVAAQDGQFVVRTQLYADDGDGRLGDADRPLRVGNLTLETTLPVVSTGDGNGSAPVVNTPTQPAINTPAKTTGTSPPAESSPTSTAPSTDSTSPTPPSSGTGGGFGVGVAFVAATLASVLWFVRRTDR
ncbi:DUF7282 domain-containing protein [Halomarina rubra]|uniref:DUF7282 domain-containing protein n=1 Tax=Halomarina rubra TaxID=2071873 RepID=A0ABD6ATB5_9EURY|nr:hypothetical protein [Halomarina rubra]